MPATQADMRGGEFVQKASLEVIYDDDLTPALPPIESMQPRTRSVPAGEGGRCHGGADRMTRSCARRCRRERRRWIAMPPTIRSGPARSAAIDVPGLRLRCALACGMRRTASVLSGSACCVYGLTFTSHFYGARRTVGYVPFNSESLVTGKLFEDIKEAVEGLADPELYDAIVVTNLCVPTASGVPLRLLGKEVNGVRIIGIDVPGFGIPTHAEAKDVLAGAMLAYARSEVRSRPGERSAIPVQTSRPITPAGRNVPGRSDGHCPDAGADGPCCRAGRTHSRMARALCRARLRSRRGNPSLLHGQCARVRSGRPHSCRLSLRWAAMALPPGSPQSAMPAGSAPMQSLLRKTAFCPQSAAALAARPIKGRITVSGYEGSELLVARLLDRKRRGCALCRHRLPPHRLRLILIATGSRPAACACSIEPASNRI